MFMLEIPGRKRKRSIPDFVVIQSLQNLNMLPGHRGRMEIEITFRGISAHGLLPERGMNAIYMAIACLLESKS